MRHLMAMYIPNPERAVVPALIQLGLIAILASSLYAYLRPRCGRKATLAVLLFAEAISFLPTVSAMLVCLGRYGSTYHGFGANYSDSVLILTEYFELFGFGICSFIALTVSALLLFLATVGKQQSENGGKAESPPDGLDNQQ
jgi:hypothetical protein